jgi:acyl-CoA thioesterase
VPARDTIVDILALEPTGPDTYRAENLSDSHGVVYGGQLLAQITTAAGLAMPELSVKSLHNVFTRGGDPHRALEVRVERQHSGRSFGTVAVTVRQGDRLCCTALVLLHQPDDDLIRHQAKVPSSLGPTRGTPGSAGRGWAVRIDDGVDLLSPDAVGPAELNVWSRFEGGPHDSERSKALIAYASDGFLIGTAMRPHAGVGQAMAHTSISTSVITQTLVFHEPIDAGSWHLLAHESDFAGSGRAFGRANVFTEDGRHVASYSQESMVRRYATDRAPAPGTASKY